MFLIILVVVQTFILFCSVKSISYFYYLLFWLYWLFSKIFFSYTKIFLLNLFCYLKKRNILDKMLSGLSRSGYFLLLPVTMIILFDPENSPHFIKSSSFEQHESCRFKMQSSKTSKHDNTISSFEDPSVSFDSGATYGHILVSDQNFNLTNLM